MKEDLKTHGVRQESLKGSPQGAVGASERRAYVRPELRAYGRLHSLTQATGPANGDGGQNMMA